MQKTTRGIRLLRRAAVAALLAVGLAACESSPAERLDSARAYLEEGNAPAAIIELKNVLQDDPVNTEARLLLARASFQAGDAATAAKEFGRAVDLGASLDEVGAEYAEALARAGASARALEIAGEAMETSGERSRLQWIRGLALVGLGRPDEAEAAFRAAAQDPEQAFRAQLGLARVANAKGDPGEALEILDGLADEGEEVSEYWEIRGFTLMASRRPEEAAEAFRRAIQTSKEAFGGRRFVLRGARVEALLGAGEVQAAAEMANNLLSEARQHPLPNYLMARVELQSGNPKEALAYAQAVLAAQPDSALGNTMAGAASVAMGQPAQAEQYLVTAVESDPGNIAARKLLAQVRLGLRTPEAALEALAPMVAGGPDAQTAALSGMASIRAGDPEAAVELLRKQLENDPDNATLRNFLAVSLIAAGRAEEALEELEQVSSADEEARTGADLLSIAAQLEEGRFALADESAARLAEGRPEDVAVRNALGALFLSVGRVDEAAAWFQDVLRLDPGNLAATFNLGRLAAVQGQPDEAAEQFSAVLKADPDNIAAKSALAQVAWSQGETERAVALLQEVRRQAPNAIQPRLLLAQFLAESGEADAAADVAREAVEARPQDARAVSALGRSLLASGQTAAALELFQQAVALAPNDPRYLVDEARAHAELGSDDTARVTLNRALAIDPEFVPALAALVDLERQAGRLAEAGAAFSRLAAVTPEGDPRLKLMEGELLLATGDVEGARNVLQEAVDANVGGRAVVALWQARAESGDDNPETTLMAWLADHPDDNLVRTLLANQMLNEGNYPEAIRQFEELQRRAPNSPVILNNLAWLYDQQGDAKALEMARQAYRLAPESGAIADTYGWILHGRGESEEAVEILRQAVNRSPDQAEIRYHYAVVLAETGDIANASREVKRILSDTTAVQYHDDAQALLDRLGSAQGDVQ
ncbi:MAG: PEP-CTERM system TPR-repeat protein PrsT [Gammaproteobacteria bacterium]